MMMRKLSVLVVTVFVLALLAPGNVLAKEKVIQLKMAHQWPQDPKDYVVATGIKFVKEVEKRTKGKVKITMYPAESLVKAADTYTALRTGTVDMSIYPYIYAAGAIPELNILMLPGLWKNQDEVYAFQKCKVWKYIENKIEKHGFRTLCWIQIAGGVASTKKAVHVPADIKGMRVRAAGKFNELGMRNMGAIPVSMTSSEIYMAMQRGLLEAMWTSSSSFGAYHIYDVSHYYTSPEKYTFYFTIEPICISNKAWAKLTPEEQKVMVEVGKELEPQALKGAKEEDALIAQEFASKGNKVSQMTEAEWNLWLQEFKKYVFPKFRETIPNGKWLLNTALAYYHR